MWVYSQHTKKVSYDPNICNNISPFGSTQYLFQKIIEFQNQTSIRVGMYRINVSGKKISLKALNQNLQYSIDQKSIHSLEISSSANAILVDDETYESLQKANNTYLKVVSGLTSMQKHAKYSRRNKFNFTSGMTHYFVIPFNSIVFDAEDLVDLRRGYESNAFCGSDLFGFLKNI